MEKNSSVETKQRIVENYFFSLKENTKFRVCLKSHVKENETYDL